MTHIEEAFKQYARDPGRWYKRYQDQCSPKEDDMSVKYKFRFFEGKGKHKFRWHAVAVNGRIVCSAEGYLHKHGPRKTVKNFIDAIRKGQYTIEEEEPTTKE